jgi:hypothetical protein
MQFMIPFSVQADFNSGFLSSPKYESKDLNYMLFHEAGGDARGMNQ